MGYGGVQMVDHQRLVKNKAMPTAGCDARSHDCVSRHLLHLGRPQDRSGSPCEKTRLSFAVGDAQLRSPCLLIYWEILFNPDCLRHPYFFTNSPLLFL
jgi:hypothetical protein